MSGRKARATRAEEKQQFVNGQRLAKKMFEDNRALFGDKAAILGLLFGGIEAVAANNAFDRVQLHAIIDNYLDVANPLGQLRQDEQ